MSAGLIVVGCLVICALAAVAWNRLVGAVVHQKLVARLLRALGHVCLGTITVVVIRELVEWQLTRWEAAGAGLLVGLAVSVAAPYVLRFGSLWAEARARHQGRRRRTRWEEDSDVGEEP